MEIKYHPVTIIEIYPDGKIEMFRNEPKRWLDKIKIRLIENVIRDRKAQLAERVPAGIYRVYATNYNWIKRKTKFALRSM